MIQEPLINLFNPSLRWRPVAVRMIGVGGLWRSATSLIAPRFVKPFVKGNKTDRNDAESGGPSR